ncbi:LptF/LptG family permease [Aquibium sp. A9E412]|uniref:LptF/LptG family permease n=1 Tax=Aquibium sp. A9E412 TaxID=2976767 RepID=UPI0025AED7E9|nr:LptF/LptG family permease [Aquibium sp. A9E412]MDN2565020.1 LptF/LptG family permease [Aquibium sp. A9E412]
MTSLIERYIFRRVLGLALVMLIASTTIVLITQILIRINVITTSGEALVTFLKIAAFLVPSMIVVVMPFALLIAATRVFDGMNGDSELSVLEASGKSPRTTARPVLVLALITSLVTLGISLAAEPWANRKLRDVLTNAGADLLQVAIQAGTFTALDENLYVQIGEQLPGGTLGQILLVDLRDDEQDLIYYAKRGVLLRDERRDLLLLREGELHRKSRETGELWFVRFETSGLDLSDFRPAMGEANYLPKEYDTGFLLDPDPENHLAKHVPHLLRSELHRRLTDWLYAFLFGVIAVYFASRARSNREEQMWNLTVAFAIALALRGAGFLVINEAGESTAVAVLAYALPVGASAAFLALLLLGRQAHVPQKLVDRVTRQVETAGARLERLQLRMKGYRGRGAESRP